MLSHIVEYWYICNKLKVACTFPWVVKQSCSAIHFLLCLSYLSNTAKVPKNLVLSLRRFPKDAVVFLLLLIYFPVGVCLILMRIFIGVHVFLVSCALPESFVRRQVFESIDLFHLFIYLVSTNMHSQHQSHLYVAWKMYLLSLLNGHEHIII